MSDNVRAHQERESIMTKTSRFNYIKRGLVGVCAATMLTGLCAGAAFAAVPSIPADTSDTTPGAHGLADATAKSTVGLDASSVELQISATVPQTIPLGIGADGGLVTPADKVTVKNTSIVPLKISGITASKAADSPVDLVAQNTSEAGKVWITLTNASTVIDLSVGTSAGDFKLAAQNDTVKFDIAGGMGSLTPAMLGKIKAANGTGVISFADITWTVSVDEATA